MESKDEFRHLIWKWQWEDRRPTWDETFMMMAEIAAARSTCDRGPTQRLRGHKGTGAIIVSPDNRKIAGGYCGSPPGDAHCDHPKEARQCPTCGTVVEHVPLPGEEGFGEGPFIPVSGRGVVCKECDRDTIRIQGGHVMIDGHCVRTVHAERNAILNATFELEGCRIYTTTAPCHSCCKDILSVKIVEVIYQHLYESFETKMGLALLMDQGVRVRQLKI